MSIKRLLSLLIACFLTVLVYNAGAQTVTQAEFFVDEDPGFGNGTPISITSGALVDQNFDVDASGLPLGINRVFVRVQQDNGLWSVPVQRFFFVLDDQAKQLISFRTDIIAAEYFIDADPGPGKGKPIPVQKADSLQRNWVAETDTFGIGNHFLYVRAKSADGFWGIPDTVSFSIDSTICQVPVVDFTFDTVDIDTNIGLTDLSSNLDSPTYAWDVGDDGSTESTSASFDTQFGARGVYPIRLTVTNTDGCAASIVRDVFINGGFPTAIALSANDSLLVGDSIDLTAPGGYAYEWNTGDTTQSIRVGKSGTYYAFLSSDGITYTTERIQIQVYDSLAIDFDSFDATAASNGAAKLNSISSSGLPYSISWSTGAQDVRALTGLAPGNYDVTITTPIESVTVPFTISSISPAADALLEAEYFIESDPGPGNGTPISVYQASILDLDFSVDLTGFEIGLHQIYTRVKQANGIWSIPKVRLFYVIDPNAKVYIPLDWNLVEAEYFFDNDPGIGNGINIPLATSKTVDIDFPHLLNDLEGGIHSLYIRTRQDDGTWSPARSITFFVIGDRFEDVIVFKNDIVAAEYFFDTDPGPGKATVIPLQKGDSITNRPWAAKTDGLPQGNHTLYLRLQNQDGIWNVVRDIPFTVNTKDCVPPVADFAFDTIGTDVMVGLTDLSTGLSDSVTYAWDILGDGTIESTDPGFDTSFSEKGVYPIKLTVTNFPDSCFTSVIKDIYVTDGFPNQITSSNTDSLLLGDSIIYTAPAGFTYEWSTGDTTRTLTVKENGSFFVWLSADGISYKSESVQVRFFKEISANLAVYGNSPGVENGAAQLTNIDTDGLPFNILWSNGAVEVTQLSGLAPGNYQAQISTFLDTATFTFIINDITLNGTEIVKAEYFIGTDPGPGNGVELLPYQADSVNFNFSPAIDTLTPGLYELYIRAKQASGLWGLARKKFFYVIDPSARVYEELDRNIVGAEYYIDSDPGTGSGTFIPIASTKSVDQTLPLEATNLSNGLHFFYLRMLQDDGLWGAIERLPFFVIDSVQNKFVFIRRDIVAAEYFFDKDPGVGNGIPMPIQKTDSLTNRPWSAATAGLQQGKHRLNIRVQNQQGIWNTIRSTEVFLYPSTCDFPEVDFTFDTVGANVSIGLTDLSTNVLPGATYKWDIMGDGSIESTDPAFDPQFESKGVYPIRMTITNSEGCFRSIVKDVMVTDGFPGALALSGNDSLLVGETLTITAPAGYTYEWNTGDSTQTLDVTKSGNYFVYLSDSGITFRSEKVRASFFKPIDVALRSFDATGGLNNGAARLDSLNSHGLPLAISWSTGALDVTQLQNLAPGSYSIDLTTPLETVNYPFDILAGSTAPNSLVAFEYYIDTDPGIGLGTPLSAYQAPLVEFSAPVIMSGLPEGPHNFFVRGRKDNGLWGMPLQKRFFVLSTGDLIDLTFGGDIVYAEYAFDSLPVPGQGVSIAITPGLTLDESLAVDITGLTAGTHDLFIQVKDASANWSFSEPESFTVCTDVPAAPTASDPSGCPGDDIVLSITGTTGIYNWYDSTGTLLLGGSATPTYAVNNVLESQTFFASQSNGEGCTSPLTEITINITPNEIFAGPDLETFPVLDTIQLSQEFPKGGTWSGMFHSWVNAQGQFRPSAAGLGSYPVIYTIDSAGCTLTDLMYVNVVEFANDPPIVDPQTFVVQENIPSGTSLGILVATDPDGDPIRFNGLSPIDTTFIRIDTLTGELFVKDSAQFDFETNNTLTSTIRVTDPFYEVDVLITFTIEDINEVPILEDQTFSIDENSALNASIGTLSVTDPEGNPVTFAIQSGNETGALALSPLGELTIADSSQIDFELNPTFVLNVYASDTALTDSASITVNINDVNEVPLTEDTTFTLAENTPAGNLVGILSATDPESQALTYSITAGNTTGTFDIGSGTGLITVVDSSALDFETTTSFALTISITDGTNSVQALATINLSDVDEIPVLADTTFQVAENSVNGLQIGQLQAVDQEGQALTYAITSGNADGTFDLSAAGVLSIADSLLLDFETNPVFVLAIDIFDGTNSGMGQVTIEIQDVNESPTLADQALQLNENSPNGEQVVQLTGIDPEGQALSYSIISGNDQGGFMLSTDGNLTVADSSALDFETTASFTLEIQVSDGSLTTNATLSIELLDVNEVPVLTSETFTIDENLPNGSAVGQLSGVDPDGDALTYSVISGNELGGFALSISGALTVNDVTVLDFEATPLFELIVEVSDGEFTNSGNVTIDLNDVPEGISEADSNILVALYQQTGGINWTNNTGWSSGTTPIAQWHGIESSQAGIITLNLAGNNLTGSVPEELLGLSGLTNLNLANNQLVSVPELTLINELQQLNVSGNRLQFNSLESLVDFGGTLTLAPQQNALQQTRVIVELGNNGTINRQIGGSANIYSWFKDGAPYPAGSGPEITLTAESFESEAVYHAEVTNLIVDGVTITTRPVAFRVSTLERDRLALLAIHEALNGANWTNGANWPSTDISTWSANLVTITSNRVTGLNLSNNNLQGDLPEDINDLLELTMINLSGNGITGLPEITLTGQTVFDVRNNRLDFADVIPNANVDGIQYGNQKLIGTAFEQSFEVGSPVSFNFTVGGQGNVYRWFRNGTEVATTDMASYQIPAINFETMGTYRLQVTNAAASQLTLNSADQTVWATADIEFAPGFFYADESFDFLEQGESYLFRVRQGPYDTVANVVIQNRRIQYNDIRLGNYILSALTDPAYTQTNGSDVVNFIPTYFESTIDNIEADILQLRNNISDTLFIQRQPPPLSGGEGILDVTVESDFADDPGGRINARRKVKRAGCALRKFVIEGGRTNQDGEFVLVAYQETDDEGRVDFGELVAGLYRINIQYPGVPMDESSFIQFEISEEEEQDGYSLLATVTEESIFVEVIEELGFYRKYFKNLTVFPNPANQKLTVAYDKLLARSVSMSLMSLDGRTLFTRKIERGYEQQIELEVADLEDGIYLLHFYDADDPSGNVASVKFYIRH